MFHTSPFYSAKMPPYMASSLTEKTPGAFKVEHDNAHQRAFTPLLD